MSMTTLSSKNQITLPAEIREFLHAKPGDQIILNREGMHAVLRVSPGRKRKGIKHLVGMLKAYNKAPKLNDDQAIAAAVLERDEKSKRR